jgi:hypothetical protein
MCSVANASDVSRACPVTKSELLRFPTRGVSSGQCNCAKWYCKASTLMSSFMNAE